MRKHGDFWIKPAIVAGIYGILLLISGFSSEISKVTMFTNMGNSFGGLPKYYVLPWEVDRFWDLPFAFIFIYLFYRLKKIDDRELRCGKDFGYKVGAFVAIVFTSAAGLAIYLQVSLGVGAFFALMTLLESKEFGKKFTIGFILGFSLLISIGLSLHIGFLLALIFYVGLVSFFIILMLLAALITTIFKKILYLET